MTNIEVKWQAADGYVGGRRPQVTTIDASDFVGLDRVEAEKLFDEIMEDSFRQRVCWDCDNYDTSLQEIMDAAAKLGEAE
jgi:hypothetical protein